MSELFHWLTETPEGGYVLLAVVIGAIGAYFYGMNWVIFFHNLKPGAKWVSMVPPLGGLLIAVALLVAGLGWWALLGLTDPSLWLLVYAVINGAFTGGNRLQNTENKEETDENGKHGN